MGIRKGTEQITERNEQLDVLRENRSFISELRLRDDGDVAVIRILTDKPLDVDLHEVRENEKSFPQLRYCSMEDDDHACEYCEQGHYKTRVFMFWAYLEKICHNHQDDEGIWEKGKLGNKTVFNEDKGEIVLIRKKFGKGHSNWNSFLDIYDLNGTWMDRPLLYKRSGKRGDINTTYSLQSLDAAPMSDYINSLIPQLPSLESVAKNIVSRLDIDYSGSLEGDKTEPNGEEKGAQSPEKKKNLPSAENEPEFSMNLPDED